MGKNSNRQVKKIAKQLSNFKTGEELPVRIKTSIYVNEEIWMKFRKQTEKPRGKTSELLESFMSEYIKAKK